MTFSESERAYVRSARVGRLATADPRGRPSVVPFCFALLGDDLVSPLDEKPKREDVTALRRVRDIEVNPFVAAVVDEYSEDWSQLCWLQIRGRAHLVYPGEDGHTDAIVALREKYGQYSDHSIDERPLVRIAVGHVRSWQLDAEPPGRGDETDNNP